MHYYCDNCGTTAEIDSRKWKCTCGEFWKLNFSPLDKAGFVDQIVCNQWKYKEYLPANSLGISLLGEACTPVCDASFYQHEVILKLEYFSASGSFKDRGSAVMMKALYEHGVREVIEDSSGNAGASVAAYAARLGMKCRIFVPAETSPGKLRQIEEYGAEIEKITGSREDVARACQEATEKAVYASHVYNPLFIQGTKTFIFELIEQNQGKLPEALVLPVGNGSLLLGIAEGIKNLEKSGVSGLRGMRIYAAVPFCSGLNEHQTAIGTIAEGIAIKHPARRQEILTIIQNFQGKILTIPEEDIIEAHKLIGRKGFYVEPTSAVAVAALKQIKPGEGRIVIPLTGTGLKAGIK